ncbi:MAG: sirohydrochlorin chelatase [Planctomycetota bacterium]
MIQAGATHVGSHFRACREVDPIIDFATPSTGILLVGHGTRDARGTDQFFQLAETLAQRAFPSPVQGCLLEFQQPDIPTGWRLLIEKGVKRVCVSPLLLFAAGHARSDVPELIARCSVEYPAVEHWQAGPLSRAAEIVSVLQSRIEHTCEQTQHVRDASTAVVLVGRGSYHPCATSDMKLLAAIVSHRLGLSSTHAAVAFYAMAEPKLPEVLDRVATRADISTVIVQPHLLFKGRLFDAIHRQVDEARERHPTVRFITGDYLGPCEAVADAVIRRVRLGQRPQGEQRPMLSPNG